MTMGRPRIEVNKDIIIDLYCKYKNWDIVANELGFSRATLYRRLKSFGIQRNYNF